LPDFEIRYHENVADDLEKIPKSIKKRIATAINNRLAVAPEQYGRKLQRTLAGLWKIRVGDYRIVYEISGKTITVWGVRHRKNIYPKVEKRIDS